MPEEKLITMGARARACLFGSSRAVGQESEDTGPLGPSWIRKLRCEAVEGEAGPLLRQLPGRARGLRGAEGPEGTGGAEAEAATTGVRG
jgi:hypothetical protein